MRLFRRNPTVVLEFAGQQYWLKAGDTLKMKVKLSSSDMDPGLDFVGHVTGAVKVVRVER